MQLQVLAAFISAIKVGSVTSSGGNQLETQILIALVLGGMPISGGAMARFGNCVVGSLLYVVLSFRLNHDWLYHADDAVNSGCNLPHVRSSVC